MEEGSPDQGLLSEKGGNGFPYVIFMDASGAVLTDRMWPDSKESVMKAYEQAQQRAGEIAELRAKVAKDPDNAVAAAELKMQLAMMYAMSFNSEEATQLLQTEGIDKNLRDRFRNWSAAQQISKVLAAASKPGLSREQAMQEVQNGCYKLLKDGVRLGMRHEMAAYLYHFGLLGAIANKDLKLAEEILPLYEKYYKQNYKKDIAEQAVRDMKAKVEALQAQP